MRVLEELARAPGREEVPARLPRALALLHAAWRDLLAGRVPLEDLTVSQRLSREISEYQARSPAARAALQLKRAGKVVRPGQRVRYLITRGEPGVHAWDLEREVDRQSLDQQGYLVLLHRAAGTVLGPFGVEASALEAWIVHGRQPPRQLPLAPASGEAPRDGPGASAIIQP
jgi:DNA polymerase elongation subunit (family B)